MDELKIKKAELYSRDTSLVYYDVTNYYFETDDLDDDFKKKGISKEHRPNPIVQLGLFMDNNRIPITYQLFPGNTNDCLTFRPNLKKIKMDYNLGKVVVVADKGMTTGDNIWYTLSSKDGYVFSMSIRGADKEQKDYVLNDCGYEWLGLNTNENLDFIPALFRSLPPTVGKWKCIGDYGKLKNLSM